MVDRIESSKDLVQEIVESTATRVGRIATIITTAVADVAREVGEIVTDGFEMREAARRARLDDQRDKLAHDDTLGDVDVDDDEPADLDAAGEQPALPTPTPKLGIAED